MSPAPTVIAAWAQLLRAHRMTLGKVEMALKAAGLPPLSWYDVLRELQRTRTPLRLNVLETRLLLAQYNLSRLLDRMAAAGLIVRTADPNDGRGRLVSLTTAGREMRRRMWPAYAAAIQSSVSDQLAADEAAALVDLLEKLAQP